MNGKETDSTKIAIIMNDIQYIKYDVADIKKQLHADYVTRQEFEPVKRIAYGILTLIVVPVVGAILALVIRK